MKKYAIFVGTTGGAVQIERLTSENAPQSVVCESGTTTSLPISNDYHDYVRPGTGVIENKFGPFQLPSFRADVVGRIDMGLSWQLPFFLAHAISASPEATLVRNAQDADHVIWATGRVEHHERNILSVNDMRQKLDSSRELFESFALQDKRLSIIIPTNQDIANELEGEFTVLRASNADDVLREVDLILETSKNTGTNSIVKSFDFRMLKRGYFVGLMYLIVAIVIAIVVASLWSQNNDQNKFDTVKLPKTLPLSPASKKDDERLSSKNKEVGVRTENLRTNDEISGRIEPKGKGFSKNQRRQIQSPLAITKPLDLKLIALKAPAGENCLSINFGLLEALQIPLAMDNQNRITGQRLNEVCGLRFSLDVGSQKKYISMWLERKSGRMIGCKLFPNALSGTEVMSGMKSFTCQLPRNSGVPLHYKWFIISSDSPSWHHRVKLKRMGDKSTKIKELSAKNITVISVDIYIKL